MLVEWEWRWEWRWWYRLDAAPHAVRACRYLLTEHTYLLTDVLTYLTNCVLTVGSEEDQLALGQCEGGGDVRLLRKVRSKQGQAARVSLTIASMVRVSIEL